MNAYSLKAASFLLFAASLAAQAGSAQLADGRILTLVQPPRTFLTEGPITAVNAGSQQLDAQGVTVTIPASVNGVAFQMLGTNFNGAPITAATIHALLDENAAPGGRDAGTPLRRGAVRSIFSSSLLQVTNAQDAPSALATRTHLELIRSQIAASHVVPMLLSEGIPVPAQADVIRPNRFEYTGATLKSAGRVYRDALGNRFLIPDLEGTVELAENLISGAVTSVSTTGDYPSFVIGKMPVVLNPDPRFPMSIVGLGGAALSPQTFFQQLSASAFGSIEGLVAGGYVVDGVLFATSIECPFSDPLLLPQVSISLAQFNNARNELRLLGTVDRPFGLTVRVELLRNDVTVATYNPAITIDPLLAGAGEWTLRQRGGIPGGLATISALRVSLVDALGTVVNSRTWLRSQL